MLSFLYVYSDHSILECYNLFSGVELSMRSFCVISELATIKDELQKMLKLHIIRPSFPPGEPPVFWFGNPR